MSEKENRMGHLPSNRERLSKSEIIEAKEAFEHLARLAEAGLRLSEAG